MQKFKNNQQKLNQKQRFNLYRNLTNYFNPPGMAAYNLELYGAPNPIRALIIKKGGKLKAALLNKEALQHEMASIGPDAGCQEWM